jgi:hypothetical protein
MLFEFLQESGVVDGADFNGGESTGVDGDDDDDEDSADTDVAPLRRNLSTEMRDE